MMAVMSKPWGQRVEQVWQAAHNQGVSDSRAMSSWPNCTARDDLVGLPVEELRHGAAAGAFYALVAQVNILSQFVLDALGQFRADGHRLA